MTAAPLVVEERVATAARERLGSAVEEVKVEHRGRISITARKETARDVATCLHEMGFDHTIAVAGVDYPVEKRIEVIYFVSSFSSGDLKHVVVSLRINLDRDKPSMQTLTPIWESASFFEREAYEMFGVDFEGRPNLQKLLLQDNWDGPPPLRKDLRIPEMA